MANRYSETADEWVNIFKKYNDGLYNNQWMIVDYKQFKKTQGFVNNKGFYVAEQIPGFVVYGDMTEHIKKYG